MQTEEVFCSFFRVQKQNKPAEDLEQLFRTKNNIKRLHKKL